MPSRSVLAADPHQQKPTVVSRHSGGCPRSLRAEPGIKLLFCGIDGQWSRRGAGMTKDMGESPSITCSGITREASHNSVNRQDFSFIFPFPSGTIGGTLDLP